MRTKDKNRKRMQANYKRNPKKYRQISRENRKQNPESPTARIARLIKNRYGLVYSEYERLVAAAEGKCAICKKKLKLTIDHNHTTGKVRGLLCGNCNRGIGLFFENKDSLLTAVKYLS